MICAVRNYRRIQWIKQKLNRFKEIEFRIFNNRLFIRFGGEIIYFLKVLCAVLLNSGFFLVVDAKQNERISIYLLLNIPVNLTLNVDLAVYSFKTLPVELVWQIYGNFDCDKSFIQMRKGFELCFETKIRFAFEVIKKNPVSYYIEQENHEQAGGSDLLQLVTVYVFSPGPTPVIFSDFHLGGSALFS